MTHLDILIAGYSVLSFGLGMLAMWSIQAWQDYRRAMRLEGENPFFSGDP